MSWGKLFGLAIEIIDGISKVSDRVEKDRRKRLRDDPDAKNSPRDYINVVQDFNQQTLDYKSEMEYKSDDELCCIVNNLHKKDKHKAAVAYRILKERGYSAEDIKSRARGL